MRAESANGSKRVEPEGRVSGQMERLRSEIDGNFGEESSTGASNVLENTFAVETEHWNMVSVKTDSK